MAYLTDIEIAQAHTMRPIEQVAATLGLEPQQYECYGRYKAKLDLALAQRPAKAKLVLVTAINPTRSGEGKTTTTIGLADALCLLGHKAVVALREPSLGPVFGVKGGATGGGYAQVVPMEDINLHFTGDFHAITAANNLLCAMLDNHIYQGNELDIDPTGVCLPRCLDVNDRQLRRIQSGLGGPTGGVPREDGFCITVASEVMAILCLATSPADLKQRLGRMVVAYTQAGAPVTAHDLQAEGAMAALLRDALRPNLVQTLQGTPALVHGGPFANIAHGCNSVLATRTAMALADYVVTEAGFGADLGAEKFLDIKCRLAGLVPDAVVVVATVRALKLNGGATADDLATQDLDALQAGLPNLLRHVHNMRNVYGLPTVVALNCFPTDTQAEIDCLRTLLAQQGIAIVASYAWAKGGQGAVQLAQAVTDACRQPNHFAYCYAEGEDLKAKIEAVATRVYHADGVEYAKEAEAQIQRLQTLGYGSMPVCIAKTQYSFSDDATLLGAPTRFVIHVRAVKPSAGAGFVVVYTGNVLTMPGLPKVPAANRIDLDDMGVIHGLF